MGKLYRQFGDVFATDDFRTWWLEEKRGETLFAEPAPQETLRELRSATEWDQTWKRSDMMVVAVPLSDPKWRLARSFAALLKERHTGKPGVVSKARSGATRSVCGKFSVPALETMCKVYELHKTSKASGVKLTLAQIGKKARVQIDYGSKTKEQLIYDDEAQRNVMASTVSRYLKKAAALIEYVGQGEFPRFK